MAIEGIGSNTFIQQGGIQPNNVIQQNDRNDENNASATLQTATNAVENNNVEGTTVKDNENDTNNTRTNEDNGSGKRGEPGSLLDVLA